VGPVTIPILPSPDFDATAAFYAVLGFVERGRWPEQYLIIEHPNGLELHFWAHTDLDPLTNDVGCFVRFDTVDECCALHDAWSAAAGLPPAESRAIPRLHAAREEPDGSVEWAVIDLHGNLLRLGAFPP
jgi:catechol 2,3-dioxygenase-like lactoylglutathione lyase family enzyme